MITESTLSIGIMIRPEDEARLEKLLDAMQKNQPYASEEECLDMIFRVGLETIESLIPTGE